MRGGPPSAEAGPPSGRAAGLSPAQSPHALQPRSRDRGGGVSNAGHREVKRGRCWRARWWRTGAVPVLPGAGRDATGKGRVRLQRAPTPVACRQPPHPRACPPRLLLVCASFSAWSCTPSRGMAPWLWIGGPWGLGLGSLALQYKHPKPDLPLFTQAFIRLLIHHSPNALSTTGAEWCDQGPSGGDVGAQQGTVVTTFRAEMGVPVQGHTRFEAQSWPQSLSLSTVSSRYGFETLEILSHVWESENALRINLRKESHVMGK